MADPDKPADNQPPLAKLQLRNQAVATSGGYARPLIIGGKRFSHILDPRSGRPAQGIRSATVLARDAETADALATALCVLGPVEGLKLIAGMEHTECLLVTAAGKIRSSPGWPAASLAKAPIKPKATHWPKDYCVRIRFTLANSETSAPTRRKKKKKKKFKRHFLGAWVEDAAGRPVKLLALWAKRKEFKYVKQLDAFWLCGRRLASETTLQAMSRATRPPGAYTLVWDGTDQNGKAVQPGTYHINLDINREKGPPNKREQHTHVKVQIDCRQKQAAAKAADRPELKGVEARFGPAGER